MVNLYDNKIYFAITFNGFVTYLIEPDKWNKITNHIVRDNETYGFWSDFLEDKYGLKFSYLVDGDLVGGGSLLKNILDTYGQSAEAYFSFGYMEGNTPVKQNEWRINLAVFHDDIAGVSTSIEKMPFQAKLKSRQGTACTVNSQLTMDSQFLTSISSDQLRLHSKSVYQTTRCVSTAPQISTEFYDSAANIYELIIQPDLTSHVIDELKTVYNQPMGLINTTIKAADYTPVNALQRLPFTDLISQYTATTSGAMVVKFSGSLDIWYYRYGIGGLNFLMKPRVVVQRLVDGNLVIVESIDGTVASPIFIGFVTIPANSAILPTIQAGGAGYNDACFKTSPSFTWDDTYPPIQIQKGDNVYIQIFMEYLVDPFPGIGLAIQIDNYTNYVEITQLTTTVSTNCEAFKIIDVLNQQLENITGRKNSVISPFFEEGGAGYNYHLTNGYRIRNYGDISFSMKKDFQSTVQSLQAIWCLGAGIKKVNGEEYFVIDSINNFFKNVNIATFQNTLDWEEDQDSTYCFNQANLGFVKYKGLDLIQQDEFCTEAQYLIQNIKLNGNTLNKKCDFITSGYLIEEQRRNQFELNPGQSLQFDDDVFLIASNKNPKFYNITLDFDNTYGLPIWEIGNNYTVGWIFIDPSDSLSYVCIVDVFSTSTPPSFDPTNWRLQSGLPHVWFNRPMFLLKGDKCECNGLPITIISQEKGFPNINNQDLYLIEGGGAWSPGFWFKGNILSDTVDNILYYCVSDNNTGVRPGLDGVNWVVFNSMDGSYDIVLFGQSPNQYFSERNEPFEICSGVIDPNSIYNARISLKHILYNWRPILGIGLSSLQTTSRDYSVSQIVTTLARMNSLLTTKFRSSEPHKLGVGDLTLTEISREFIKNYLSSGENLFSPKSATFKVRTGYDIVIQILKALNGESVDEPENYGGITARDYNGVDWFCKVMDIQYDFVAEIATIKVQKCAAVLI